MSSRSTFRDAHSASASHYNLDHYGTCPLEVGLARTQERAMASEKHVSLTSVAVIGGMSVVGWSFLIGALSLLI
jgi:hypothetical protein